MVDEGNMDCSDMVDGMLESLLESGAPMGAGKAKASCDLKSPCISGNT